MKHSMLKKVLSFILSVVLIAAMALVITGCNDKEEPQATTSVLTDGQSVGQGAHKFTFTVVNPDGTSVTVQVSTDKTNLGEALQELGIIAGEQGDYGLYVKTVNGITLDYAKDGKFWSLYEGDTQATTGVDGVTIRDGGSYSFKAE